MNLAIQQVLGEWLDPDVVYLHQQLTSSSHAEGARVVAGVHD